MQRATHRSHTCSWQCQSRLGASAGFCSALRGNCCTLSHHEAEGWMLSPSLCVQPTEGMDLETTSETKHSLIPSPADNA